MSDGIVAEMTTNESGEMALATTVETSSSEPHETAEVNSSVENQGTYEEADFGALASKFQDGDEDDEEADLTPPVQAAAPEPLEEEAVEVAPEPPIQEVAEEVKADTVAEEPVVQATPEEIAKQLAEHRAKTLPELVKAYALTPEQEEALQTNPEKVLPELAAKMHYDIHVSAYNAMLTALPQMVNNILTTRNSQAEAEEQFFSQWGQLRDKKYEPILERTFKAYRAANPKADRATAIKEVGAMAMMAAGLSIEPPASQQPTAQRTLPYKPAVPGGVGASQSVGRGQSNLFADLTEAYMSEMVD